MGCGNILRSSSLRRVSLRRSTADINIPFAFLANRQVLPASCYLVKLLSDTTLGLINCESQ